MDSLDFNYRFFIRIIYVSQFSIYTIVWGVVYIVWLSGISGIDGVAWLLS